MRAEPAYIAHDGFVPARDDYAQYDRDIAERASSYAARSKACSEDFQAYNKAIDDRIAWESRSALKPLRHVESIAEAGERKRAAWAALGGLASIGSAALSAVASSLPSIEDNSLNLGDISDVGPSGTPLGDAAPFEYIKSAASELNDTVGGVFLTPAEEAECMLQYNLDMVQCSAYYSMQKSSWGMCSGRASQRLARCVRGKGIM